MTQDELYDEIRKHERKGEKPLRAFYLTMKKEGSTILEYNDVTGALFIYCEYMNSESVRIIDFLLFSINYNWDIYPLAGKAYLRVKKR